LKSAVKREIDLRGKLSLEDKREIAFEFQNAVTEVLAYKLINLAKQK
jgi:tRNA A37 threonylcarbamoyltransferase TsaD